MEMARQEVNGGPPPRATCPGASGWPPRRPILTRGKTCGRLLNNHAVELSLPGAAPASDADARDRLEALLVATGGLTFVADATGGTPRPLQPAEAEASDIPLGRVARLTDLAHENARAAAEADWAAAVASAAPITAEWRLDAGGAEPRLIRVRAAPTVDGDGRVREWIGLVVEVTEFRRAAAEVRREQEFAASIIAASRDGILAFDRAGRPLQWNAPLERLTRASGRQVGEALWHQLFPFAEPALLIARCADMLADGEPFLHCETIGMAALGMARMLEFAFSPVRDAMGAITGGLCEVRDVTERQLLDTRIRQSAKMDALGVLAAGIAHDFNNSLAAMLGLAELARLDVPRSSPAHEVLGELLASGARARELVRQILTFSRQERAERVALDLRDVLGEAMRLLRTLIPATIEIRVHTGEGPIVVAADPTQLQQVLVNLCTNAEHAMRATGTGTLELAVEQRTLSAEEAATFAGLRAGPHAQITVRDTGMGIPSAMLERIFDPFFTTKASGEGTGMGLSVVHGVVAAHHGAISVTSVPGQGTTFTVLLPLVSAPLATRPDGTEEVLEGHGVVYIVDDDPTIARLLATGLARFGFRTRAFDDSMDALRAFEEDPGLPDAVVCDVLMPRLSGDSLSQRLLRRRPDLAVLLLSGSAPRIQHSRTDLPEVAECLLKPVGFRTLARALVHHIALRRGLHLADTAHHAA